MSVKQLRAVCRVARPFPRSPSAAANSCAGSRFFRGSRHNEQCRFAVLRYRYRQYGVPGNAHKEKSNAQKPVPKRIGVRSNAADGSECGGSIAGVRSRVIGLVKDMTKSEAREAVDRIVDRGQRQAEQNRVWQFGEFVAEVYFPYYSRKWKHSTRENNVNRVSVHLVTAYSGTGSFPASGATSFRICSTRRRKLGCRFRSSIICGGI